MWLCCTVNNSNIYFWHTNVNINNYILWFYFLCFCMHLLRWENQLLLNYPIYTTIFKIQFDTLRDILKQISHLYHIYLISNKSTNELPCIIDREVSNTLQHNSKIINRYFWELFLRHSFRLVFQMWRLEKEHTHTKGPQTE